MERQRLFPGAHLECAHNELEDTVSQSSSLMPNHLSALQSSRSYEPLDRRRVIGDYKEDTLDGNGSTDKSKLCDIQLKIRPLLERLDEDIDRLDKKIYGNLNCCKIKESRVEWLLNGHKMLGQFGEIVGQVTLDVLDPLEQAITLRLRGCDAPLIDDHIDRALMGADERLSQVSFILKQKVFAQS